jgi:hypothetical protein
MKKLKVAFVLFATALLLAGCVASSVYPFYTSRDAVFEPSLLGQWNPINPESNLEETNDPIEFQALGKSAYLKSAAKNFWIKVHSSLPTDVLALDLFLNTMFAQ